MQGKVYLVGAGPGDPGLVTVKALKLLSRGDVIIYDQLASPELLREARPGAEVIYVGKKAGAHTLPQGGINQLLVDKAKAGLTVVRLKGGDPFVFGRGGEEAEALAAAGIPFEVVPGVTSAVAVPAYAGIPVTHRDYTTLVTFITGHEDPTKAASTIPWDNLGQNPGTLVFLMGVKNLAANCRRLIEAGRSPETPAALIQSGTLPSQRTVSGTLATIAEVAEAAGMAPPAILVVGGVAELAGPPGLVGKTAPVGQNRGGDPHPGAGQRLGGASVRGRGPVRRSPHPGDRPARRFRPPGCGPGASCRLCLGDLHQRQRGGRLFSAAF